MKAAKFIVYSGKGSAIDNYNSAVPVHKENWGILETTTSMKKMVRERIKN